MTQKQLLGSQSPVTWTHNVEQQNCSGVNRVSIRRPHSLIHTVWRVQPKSRVCDCHWVRGGEVCRDMKGGGRVKIDDEESDAIEFLCKTRRVDLDRGSSGDDLEHRTN